MALLPATNKQVPEHSIMDLYGKQAYLGNQFSVGSDSVAVSGTSEVPILSISCSSAGTQNVGSSQNAKGIFCNLKGFYCADPTGVTSIIYRVYIKAVGISSGSVLTPVNMRQANPNVSIAAATLSPTVSNKGTFMYSYVTGFQRPSVSEELIILDQGMNMLITAQPSASSTSVVNVSWYEI